MGAGESLMQEGDLAVLRDAAEANPQWFEAMMLSAEIMAERRRKYSGEFENDAYFNFILLAQMMRTSVDDVFRFYRAIKLARSLADTGDFGDETAIDTEIDEANYSLLAAGWRMRSGADKIAAMLTVGPWVDSRLFRRWELE